MPGILLILILFIPSETFSQKNLSDICCWAYQLQEINISEIANNNTFELMVMDYSADGSDKNKFTSEQIQQIKESGKVVLAYISIGEAEDYRYYWDEAWDKDGDGHPDSGAPSWLDSENPQWKGNYKVRFWHHEWQEIIFSYIDTILAQGFDGIYCDIIDAYYYWSEEKGEEPQADSLMIQFILNIREHISQKKGEEFFIIPQNGEFIIEEDDVSSNLRKSYLNTIQGIGVEDLFFQGNKEEDNPWNPDEERIDILKSYIDNTIRVFSVEYLTDQNKIDHYVSEARSHNFVPYVTTRDLDRLADGIRVQVNKKTEPEMRLFELNQNYPNPFNCSTKVRFDIKETLNIRLAIVDLLGRIVKKLLNETKPPGTYTVIWNGTNQQGREVSGGIYLARLTAGESSPVYKKMIFIK